MSSTSRVDSNYRETIGHIEGLADIRPVALRETAVWCLDNSVFTRKFEESLWLRRLDSLQEYRDKCKFVVVPDVVGSFSETLEQFGHYRKMVKGFPAALVAQPGVLALADRIPWDEFECLFIGGPLVDSPALGDERGFIVREAIRRRKWLHIGRVNSAQRIAAYWMADSWDGTTLSFEPSQIDRFHRAVLSARERKAKGNFNDLCISVPLRYRVGQSV